MFSKIRNVWYSLNLSVMHVLTQVLHFCHLLAQNSTRPRLCVYLLLSSRSPSHILHLPVGCVSLGNAGVQQQECLSVSLCVCGVQEMQLVSRKQHTLPGYAFLHDFTVTRHYYVIFHNPVSLQLVPFLSGRKGAVHSVRWDPNKPLAAHLIPRGPTHHLPVPLSPGALPSFGTAPAAFSAPDAAAAAVCTPVRTCSPNSPCSVTHISNSISNEGGGSSKRTDHSSSELCQQDGTTSVQHAQPGGVQHAQHAAQPGPSASAPAAPVHVVQVSTLHRAELQFCLLGILHVLPARASARVSS